MKSFLKCIFMVFALSVSLSINVFAADTVNSGYCGNESDGSNLTWTLTEDGTLHISGTGAMATYASDAEQPWYSYQEQILWVDIADGVTSISNYAFCNFTRLNEIAIPSSVKTIGKFAFSNCCSIVNITVPESVTSIGNSAFNGCSALTEITLPFVGGTIKNSSSQYQYPFGYIFGETSYTGGTATKQTFYMFPTNSRMSATYYIPDSLRTVTITGGNILDGAFYGCSSLTNITLPDDLTAIEGYAFYNCSALTKFTFPDSVKSLGKFAFAGCTGFTSFVVPDTVTWIGEGVFNACTSLTEITLPFVGDSTKSSTTRYQYPFGYIFSTPSYSGGTYIEQPFYGYSLTNKSYFTSCIPDCLTSLTITGGNILSYAFYNCSQLTSITLPNEITAIEPYAFYNCTGLTNFTFSDKITYIGEYAFSRCTNIEEISFKGSAPTIGTKAFNSVVATAWYIADDTTWIEDVIQNYGGTITWTPHTCIDSNGNPYFEAIDKGTDSTCSTTGLTDGSHCAFCGKILVAQEIIPTREHTFGPCTELEDEESYRACLICDYDEIAEIAVATVGEYEYYSLNSAIQAAAVVNGTVTLQTDLVITGTFIPNGVTLDLDDFTLTAEYLIGLRGGYLTATPNTGKLMIDKDGLFLSGEGYKNASGQSILPIWDPSQNCYLFSVFVLNTDSTKGRGLVIDEENEQIYFQFKHQATRAINQTLLKDGSSDNALEIIVRLVWTTDNGEAYQDFVYNDAFVGKVSGSYDYTFTLNGYSAMNINLDTLSVTAMILTDSGATASSVVWTAESAN